MIKFTISKIAFNGLNHLKINISKKTKILSKFFSINTKNYAELKKEINFESEEEQDLRYEDQLFFLEREMNNLIKDKIKYGQDYTTNDFPEYQKRELNSLVEIVRDFDFLEKKYFFLKLKFYLDTLCETKPGKQNAILRKYNTNLKFNKNEFNPNRKTLDAILSPLIPYLSSDFFIGGGSGAPPAQGAAEGKEAKKEEKKEEKPKEKAEYDIKMVSFDAAKKINLIKEVRALLNLGLKEAKEMVEKSPVELMKKVKKEDAATIKAKLEESGAKIELL